MKKILVTLMMVFSLSVAAFADVKLLPRDAFNNYIASVFEDTPSIQPQIAYVADTWEDVYEKTGVGKYGWKEGDLGWICLEHPGDSSIVFYTDDVEY